MNLLKALIEDGKVPVHLDFRLGTLLDQGGMGNDCTSSGNERWINDRGRLGMLCPAGTNMQVPYHASLVLDSLSFIASVHRRRQDLAIANSRLFTRGIVTVNYGCFFNTGSRFFRFQTTGSTVTTPVASADGRYDTIGFSWAGTGTAARFYENGQDVGINAASTGTSVGTEPIYVGNFGGDASNYHFGGVIFTFTFINEPLDSADMVRLMRELDEGPQVVRRARKSFSLPYPTKTPAGYASENTLLDVHGPVVGGEWMDHVGANNVSNAGLKDAVRGPFTTALSNVRGANGGATGTINYGGATALTFEAWVRLPKSITTTDVLVESSATIGVANTWAFYVENANRPRFLVNLTGGGGGIASVYAASGSVPNGVWMHMAGVFDPTETGTDRTKLYLNGQDASDSFTGTIGTGSFSDQVLNVFARAITSLQFEGDVASIKVGTAAKSASGVRASYLMGARNLLTDASVRSDGSCPVNLSVLTPPTPVANDWYESGGFGTVQCVDHSSGDRALVLTGSGGGGVYAGHPARGPHCGSWLFETEGDLVRTMFTASDDIGTQNFNVYLNTTQIELNRGGVNLDTYAIGSAAGRWRWWVSRDYLGVMRVWFSVDGGTWTLACEATDLTITPSGFMVANETGTGYWFAFQKFLGEMTPTEAIAAGLIQ